jgi:hypothetical protein
LIDKEIEVIGFKIGNSKVKPNEKCLTIHIVLDGEKRIIFAVLLRETKHRKV